MLSLLLAATLESAPALPAAGKYWYAETVRGKTVNVVAVELQRSAATIALNEEIKPEGLPPDPRAPFIQTRSSIDPGTMNLKSFYEEAAIGCSELEYTMALDGARAVFEKNSLALTGVTHYAVDDSQAFPFLLPSQMAYWHERRIGVVNPVTGTGHAAAVDPVTEIPARPVSVPQRDAYLSVRAEASGGEAAGVWYDPQTMVIDAMRSGDAQWTRLVRAPSDAGSF